MADLTEQQIYKAFGLGAQAQEVAEPASSPESSQNTGAQAQEVAEPAQEQTAANVGTEPGADEAQPSDPASDAETDGVAGNAPLTTEQRRQNAARRRQQEQQAAVNSAVEDALRREREKNDGAMKDFFAKAGLKNTITGEPITNMEQFNAWHQQFNDAKLQRSMQSGKMTPEMLSEAIGNHPAVKQAQQLVQLNEEAERRRQEEAAKAQIQKEIDEIHALDESISSLEDLMNAPYWPELYAKTRRGYSLKDAHYLLNRERLEKAKLEAAKQQGMNNARGKNHMTATATARGTGAVSVPATEMAIYRRFNPTATDAEIQAHYNKYKKG